MSKSKQKQELSPKQKAGRFFLLLAILAGGAYGVYAILLYTSPEPNFSLPVHDLLAVSGVQVFHDNRSTSKEHTGFDFKLENSTTIYAPAGGLVTNINKHVMDNGYWIIDVTVSVNSRWSYFIAFEPWTMSEAVIDSQMQHISVKALDSISENDIIGTLMPVPGSEFPHIHWNVNENALDLFIQHNRSPYDLCSPEAQVLMYNLCRLYDKYPAD